MLLSQVGSHTRPPTHIYIDFYSLMKSEHKKQKTLNPFIESATQSTDDVITD